ncbi:hypothetical protein BD770DRAFT_386710 [Pilaira anomala]|nr:hypothetical protein BD770DRAFT_386710 [Pilaira anomala]
MPLFDLTTKLSAIMQNEKEKNVSKKIKAIKKKSLNDKGLPLVGGIITDITTVSGCALPIRMAGIFIVSRE